MIQKVTKWTQRLILVLAIIPLLLFLAFAGAVSLIDFNQYKPQIEKELGELTQRELHIGGDVEVTVLPFMFHINELSLKNPQGFPEENLLTLDEVHIELSLKTLFLQKKLDILSLELIRPHLHFYEMENVNNWQGMPMMTEISRAIKSTNQARVDNQKIADSEPAAWQLDGLVIKDAELSFKSFPKKFKAQLQKLNLMAFDIKPGQKFAVSSDFVYDHSQSPRTFEFEVNTALQLENDYSQAHLSDWSGVFRLQLPSEWQMPDIRLNTSGKNLLLDFEYQQIYVHDAVLKGFESQVLTSFQGGFGAHPIYRGEFETKGVNLTNWLEHLGLPEPTFEEQKMPSLEKLSGQYQFVWDGKDLSILPLAKP